MICARFRLALFALFVAVFFAPIVSAQSSSDHPLLLRNPSLSQDKVAFLYAGDIWTVSRQGGDAERLTSNGHVVAGPFFSPDGAQIAYSAHLLGNTDVYIAPAEGGVPRRVTWHPAGSEVVGWSPDGKNVLIASGALSYRHFLKLFLVHADGSGMPEPLPLPAGAQASYSPDGQSIAYEPITKWEPAWKRYVGGQTTPIWIVNLKTLDLVKVPRDNSNDSDPVWVGNSVYFLSDRNGPDLAFPLRHRQQGSEPGWSQQELRPEVRSGRSRRTGLRAVWLASPGRHRDATPITTLSIRIHGELPNLEPHLATVRPDEIRNVTFSPTGARAAFEAHGEIFTVPAEKGDTRNLTNTSGTAERNPSWSPDGKTIAYFSDASGEYQLFLHDQTGFKPPTVIDLGPDPSYFYNPTWSPDSKHIAFADKHQRLWVVDVPSGTPPAAAKPVLVDHGIYGTFGSEFGQVWSPDSKWIAYNRDLDNQLHAIFLYSMDTHKFTQVTDGMSDATNPAFDANGKYLYFIESTDDGPSNAGIDLSSLDRAEATAPYVVVLAKDGASPIPPESDDEKIKEEKKDEPDKSADDQTKRTTNPPTRTSQQTRTIRPTKTRTRKPTKMRRISRSKSPSISTASAIAFSRFPFLRAIMKKSTPARPGFFTFSRLRRSVALPAKTTSPTFAPSGDSRWKSATPKSYSVTWTISRYRMTARRCSMPARAAGPSPRPTT